MKKSYLLAVLLSMTLPVCAKPIVPIENFAPVGQESAWQKKLHQLNQGEAVKFRIVQLGDSHTAGGFLTDELRRQLQQRWGDGGIGVIHPNQVQYQRNGLVSFEKNKWLTLSSRKDTADFPLGGVLTRSVGDDDLVISPNANGWSPWNVRMWVRPFSASKPLTIMDNTMQTVSVDRLPENQWQTVSLSSALAPIRVHTQGRDVWDIGLIELENVNPKGVVVSALGINGAQLMHTQRWRADWQEDLAQTRADLVVVAYGTNEAFGGNVNPIELAQQWREVLRSIHRVLPEAGILVVGAPESLINKVGGCGMRPALLDSVQAMQRQVAEEQGLMYWSWQDAMGGACSMKRWLDNGLASKDGVHFSAKGYYQVGAALADAIVDLAQ